MKRPLGFTIIELLIVVAIIGIIASIVVVSYRSVQEQANETTVKTHLADAKSKLDRIRSDTGVYPTSLDGTGISEPDNITYTYYYGSTTNLFCLQGVTASFSATWYVSSLNNEPVQAGCPTMDYDAGLTRWWPLNGATVSLVDGKSGTVQGATATGGQNQSSTAYAFNGTDTYIDFPYQVFSVPMSTSVWFKAQSTSSGIGMIFYGDVSGGDGLGGNEEYHLNQNSGNYQMYFNAGGCTSTGVTLGSIGDTDWHHLVLTLAANGAYTFYKDGNLLASGSAGCTPNFSAYRERFRLGRPTSDTRYANGSLDDLRIYNRVLTAGEAASLYAAGAR